MDAKEITSRLIEDLVGRPMAQWAPPVRIAGYDLLTTVWPVLERAYSWTSANQLPYRSRAERAADQAIAEAAIKGDITLLDAASPPARRVIFERLVQLALALSAEELIGISETVIVVPSDLSRTAHWRIAMTWLLIEMPLPWPPGAFDRHGPQLRALAQTIQ
ncbi:hypothetical protein [Zavarzinia aquatilis]|uniref:hypothetical protein n=1 Tax=Zavarzinia aquatilis TaxID=2211142 RepID=UPI0010580D8E|nr:hypothetical protein [Zavarzinia aquatilis]